MTKAPLVDESFMAHTVPQMNMYEYKHRNLKLKPVQITHTVNNETQTDFDNTFSDVQPRHVLVPEPKPDLREKEVKEPQETSQAVENPFGIESF